MTVTSSDLDDLGDEVTLAIDTSAEPRNLFSSRVATLTQKQKAAKDQPKNKHKNSLGLSEVLSTPGKLDVIDPTTAIGEV